MTWPIPISDTFFHDQALDLINKGFAGPVFNVKGYGAIGDGVTNDAPAFQAAIDAAAAAGASDIYAPPADYSVATGLRVKTSSLTIRGSGSFYNADVGIISSGSRILWAGGASPMLTIEPDIGASNQALKAIGLVSLCLRGQNIAGATGILSRSVQGFWYRDLYMDKWAGVAMDWDVVSTLGENRGCHRGLIERVLIRELNGSGIGFRVGAGDVAANFNNNDILGLQVIHKNGVGVQLGNCDSNRFWSVNTNLGGASPTGIGIELLGHASVWQTCRSNLFGFVSPAANPSGFIARGTPSYAFPSVNNAILRYGRENSEATPTIEAGATLWYTGQNAGLRELELALVNSDTFVNAPAGDNEWNSDTSFRVKVDLLHYTQLRLCVPVAVAGAAGANVRVQYSTNGGSSFAGNLDGASGPAVLIDSTGMKDSGWVNIATGAKLNDIVLRLLSNSGDGVADPKISARLYVR